MTTSHEYPNPSGERRRPNSIEEAWLTPKNETLFHGLSGGIRAALFSEFTPTYELSERSGEKGIPSFMDGLSWRARSPDIPGITALPQPHYLSRIIFLRDRPTKAGAPTRFQLAIQANTYSLDATTARNDSWNQLEKPCLVWPDGVQLSLLDHKYKNRHRIMLFYNPDKTDFEVSHGMGNFLISSEKQHPTDQIANAYGIVYKWTPKTPLGHLNEIQELRVINNILHNGTLDTETEQQFIKQAEEDPGTKLLMADIPLVRNSVPYFRRVIDGSLATPDLRLTIARFQHDYDTEYWAA